MARKALPAPQSNVVELHPENYQAAADARDEKIGLDQAATKAFLDGLAAGQQIGAMQAHQAYQDLSTAAKLAQLEQMVSAGKHLGLPYRKPDGSAAKTASIEEFCAVFLHRPYSSIAEDRQNLRLVGPQLYDELERQGLQRSDWRALRNLEKVEDPRLAAALASPPEQKIERLLVLVDQLKAQQEESTKQIERLKEDLKDTTEKSKEKSAQIDKLEIRSARFERGQVPANELAPLVMNDVHRIGRTAEECIRSFDNLVIALDLCAENEWDKPENERDEASVITAIQRMQEALYRLGRKLGGVQMQFELRLLPLLSGRDTDLLREAPPEAPNPFYAPPAKPQPEPGEQPPGLLHD